MKKIDDRIMKIGKDKLNRGGVSVQCHGKPSGQELRLRFLPWNGRVRHLSFFGDYQDLRKQPDISQDI